MSGTVSMEGECDRFSFLVSPEQRINLKRASNGFHLHTTDLNTNKNWMHFGEEPKCASPTWCRFPPIIFACKIYLLWQSLVDALCTKPFIPGILFGNWSIENNMNLQLITQEKYDFISFFFFLSSTAHVPSSMFQYFEFISRMWL